MKFLQQSCKSRIFDSTRMHPSLVPVWSRSTPQWVWMGHNLKSATYAPQVVLWIVSTWCMREFVYCPRCWVPGANPSILGWSGTNSRCLSSISLNWSSPTPEMFLILAGRELNNLDPFTWKLCSINFLTLFFTFRAGTISLLPSLVFSLPYSIVMPQLGTMNSIVFQQ